MKKNVHNSSISVQSVPSGVSNDKFSAKKCQKTKKEDLKTQNEAPRYGHQTRKTQLKKKQAKVRTAYSNIVPSIYYNSKKITKHTHQEKHNKPQKNCLTVRQSENNSTSDYPPVREGDPYNLNLI